MSRKVLLVVFTGMLITVSSCGLQTENEEQTPMEPTVFAQDGSGDQAAQDMESVQVTDALGREIMLPSLPERIVVPGKGTWMPGHVFYMFPEASERVLAMEERKGSVSDFLPLIDPAFSMKPHLEYGASAEQIVPLKPDAIVMKSYMAETLGEPLELLEFPVIYVELETPDQFFHDLATIGQLLGNEERVAEIEEYYKRIRAAGVTPLTAGGDHSITYPILKALGSGRPLGVVHIDAHCDTFEETGGSKLHHAGTFRNAVLAKAVDPERVIQIGIRGRAEMLWEFSHESGMRVVHAEEFHELGVKAEIESMSKVM